MDLSRGLGDVYKRQADTLGELSKPFKVNVIITIDMRKCIKKFSIDFILFFC
jgi:hypothetical protein